MTKESPQMPSSEDSEKTPGAVRKLVPGLLSRAREAEARANSAEGTPSARSAARVDTRQALGRRPKKKADVRNYAAALGAARELFGCRQPAERLAAFDLYEQLAAAYPSQSTEILAEAFDQYQCLPDKNDRYALYQERLFDFGIQPNDAVLDIGSGHIPFPLATHLADYAPDDDSYGRAGVPFKHVQGKPVYRCNVENMGCFSDKQFDFVYCSHVLEHAQSPEKACRELMRIGKRGYIETPTRGKDLWLNTAKSSHHMWAVEYVHDTLVFTEYTPEEVDGLECGLLLDMHCQPQSDREKALTSLIYLKAELVNTMLVWDGEFQFEIRRRPTGSRSAMT